MTISTACHANSNEQSGHGIKSIDLHTVLDVGLLYSNLTCMHPSLLHACVCGYSVLHLSSMHGTSPCMKVLLDRNKCDVNAARLGDGYTPLHVAAAQGHLECAEHLLEHGAGVNNRDRSVEG